MRKCWPPNLRSLDLSDCDIKSNVERVDEDGHVVKIGSSAIPGSNSVLYEILPWLSPGIGELNLANNGLGPNDMIAFLDCTSDGKPPKKGSKGSDEDLPFIQ